MKDKHRRKIVFLGVGIWNTLFGYGIFCVLYLVLQPFFAVRYFAYTFAQVAAIILAQINAFVCHKFITFKSPLGGHRLFGEFIRFCMTYAVTYIFGFIAMPLLIEWGRLNPTLAAAFIIPAQAVVSYLGHSRFSFSPRWQSVNDTGIPDEEQVE